MVAESIGAERAENRQRKTRCLRRFGNDSVYLSRRKTAQMRAAAKEDNEKGLRAAANVTRFRRSGELFLRIGWTAVFIDVAGTFAAAGSDRHEGEQHQ